MNEAMNNLLTRRSVRKYKHDPVPADVLERIVKAGEYAPNGYGKQSAIILAVTDRAVRDKLSELNAKVLGWEQDPFYGAPVVLVVLADRSVSTYIEDGSLVLANLMNAAHAEGLGSCWIHRAKEEFESDYGKELLRSLGIQGDYVGIGNCIIGYPAEEPASPAKRKDGFVYYV